MTVSTSSTAAQAAFAMSPAALPSVAAASHIGVSRKTLSNWRTLGKGPRYVRLGKLPGARIVYRVTDLDQFLAASVIDGAR